MTTQAKLDDLVLAVARLSVAFEECGISTTGTDGLHITISEAGGRQLQALVDRLASNRTRAFRTLARRPHVGCVMLAGVPIGWEKSTTL